MCQKHIKMSRVLYYEKAKCKHKREEVTYSNEPFGIRQTCAVKGDGLQPYVTPFNEVRQFGFFNTCTEFD